MICSYTHLGELFGIFSFLRRDSDKKCYTSEFYLKKWRFEGRREGEKVQARNPS